MASTRSDPTAAYRKQQGLAPVTQSYDPTVVGWITQAAAKTGADPAALLATSIQESGARRGAVGDQGTSFGPFQFHRGGALGTHNAAWANSYPAVLNRAQEFSRLGVHGGKGAAAVQRPADRSLYAAGVQSNMAEAKAIIAKMTGKQPKAHPDDSLPLPFVSPHSNPQADVGETLIQSMMDANSRLAKLPGSASLGNSAAMSPLQSALSANSALAGIPMPMLPDATTAPALPDSTHARTLVKQPVSKVSGSGAGIPGKVVRIKGKPTLIGLPYQGTHTLYGNWESDNAVDIKLPAGTPVYAAGAGVIGSQIGAIGGNDPHMAGQRLHLKMAGNELYYQHLQSIAVKAGQRVKAGQLIGYTGAMNHLHLGALKGDPRRYA